MSGPNGQSPRDVIVVGGGLAGLTATVWVDARAGDETAVREAARAATRKAVTMAVEGRDAAAAAGLVARRDSLTNPFYGGS
jgi:succinate dehydrogenase/fumarate reductase flavoprotein subunit